MRLMGVDFGFKRIGIAVGESSPAVASPRPALTASGTLKRDAEAISALAKREGAELIVVGLPLEGDGSVGKMARICTTVAEHLRELGHQVETVDETLTSVQAEQGLHDMGLKASLRRKARDGEAACLILERYMHEKG